MLNKRNGYFAIDNWSDEELEKYCIDSQIDLDVQRNRENIRGIALENAMRLLSFREYYEELFTLSEINNVFMFLNYYYDTSVVSDDEVKLYQRLIEEYDDRKKIPPKLEKVRILYRVLNPSLRELNESLKDAKFQNVKELMSIYAGDNKLRETVLSIFLDKRDHRVIFHRILIRKMFEFLGRFELLENVKKLKKLAESKNILLPRGVNNKKTIIQEFVSSIFSRIYYEKEVDRILFDYFKPDIVQKLCDKYPLRLTFNKIIKNYDITFDRFVTHFIDFFGENERLPNDFMLRHKLRKIFMDWYFPSSNYVERVVEFKNRIELDEIELTASETELLTLNRDAPSRDEVDVVEKPPSETELAIDEIVVKKPEAEILTVGVPEKDLKAEIVLINKSIPLNINALVFKEHKENLGKIGRWGEKLLYEVLKKEYEGVDNVEIIWINEKGESYESYDILLKINGRTYYIEVKTTITRSAAFAISDRELSFARECKESYLLYHIINAGTTNIKVVKIENMYEKFLNKELQVVNYTLKY